MIKAGIFDSGGVLHSSETIFVREDICTTLKIQNAVLNRNYPALVNLYQKGLITEDEFWSRFIQKTGAKGTLPQISLFMREYTKRFRKNNQLLDLISKLKTNGYKLAVLSNTIKPHTDFLTEKGLYDLFDVKIFSHDVGLMKPDTNIYSLTLNHLGVSADEAFFVDDKSKNVTAAKKIGISGIVYTDSKSLKASLRKLMITF